MKKYQMYLNVGDWSGDGHEKHDQVLIESNLPVKDVQQAYKDSCKLTGVQLNHNEDYTGVKRDWKVARDFQILTEYESSKITSNQFKMLFEHGLRVEMLADWNGEDSVEYAEESLDGYDIYSVDAYVKFWMWFTMLSNPKLKLTWKPPEDEGIPNINGYWDKNLNVQFGYGVY
jgi:hypothetical protein